MQLSLWFATACVLLSVIGCITRPLKPEAVSSVDTQTKGLVVVATDLAQGQRMALQFYIRAPGFYTVFPFKERLTVIPMNPGTYTISDWWEAPARRYTSKRKYEFAVRAGTVIYIGAFVFEPGHATDLLGEPQSVWVPIVRDHRSRDMREFNDKFPSLAGLPVDYAVIDGFSWSDLQEPADSVPSATPATK